MDILTKVSLIRACLRTKLKYEREEEQINSNGGTRASLTECINERKLIKSWRLLVQCSLIKILDRGSSENSSTRSLQRNPKNLWLF